MKTTIEPRTGHVFLCVKNNKQHSAVKGKYYLYDSGELKTYTSRNVTLLANGDEMLELPGVFERAERCPFCDLRIYDAGMDAECVEHDTVDCGAEWDARVKHYCRDCNGDTVNGKCPKCDEAESANAEVSDGAGRKDRA